MILKLNFLYVFLLATLFIPISCIATSKQPSSNTITGAGAHFAWVIFHSLEDELEHSTGKNLELYGKNSNLGVGCNSGIKLAQQSRVDYQTFGFVCCPLSRNEIRDENLMVFPLAKEPILILINKANPLKNLSTEQVRAVFRGDITNWKELGGWDKPIAVVTRLHCKKRPGHWKTILPGVDSFTKKRINVSSADEMVQRVTSFETAIGHIGSTWEFGEKSLVKVIKINHIEATAKNLKNKSYPFYRKLSAVTNLNPSKDVLNTIKQVQQGSSFKKVTQKYNLLPIN